ncbi:BQ5605_C047g12329 [Microbotryum silenes-dioicae]|uniref:BQ5605_C047g12329 protein n=1 Tax=Microbotryum silenes-dioicae TaxID=796604 RepID=A0A2X0PPQ2_9BASI|nr:BQ5605_C047g12329 [Microbotryum silenes-dioicae]
MDFTPQDQRDAEALITACLDIISPSDLNRIKLLVEQSQVHSWVQDRQGWTALHAAAASGQAELCTFLLRKSNAVWNMVDHLGFTAGDIAYSMNNAEVYQVLLAEGVRAELLKSLMTPNNNNIESPASETAPNENLPIDDSTVFVKPVKKSTASDNATFLSSRLEFTHDSKGQAVALDEEGNGVMMGWEEPIMKRTAEWLCEPFEHRRQGSGGKGKQKALEEEEEELVVLNVGFGLGIIDTYLQTYRPTTHLIIEPHPDVLAFASSQGWFNKPNVRFFHGTWQQYQLALSNETEPYLAFDALYFDTYSEHYSDLHQFFDVLPDWLRDTSSRFSFFHGLGATSRSFYDVYTEVSEIHLKEIGLDTQWEEVEVGIGEGVWEATREGKKYWGDVGPFRMPKCRLGGMM